MQGGMSASASVYLSLFVFIPVSMSVSVSVCKLILFFPVSTLDIHKFCGPEF